MRILKHGTSEKSRLLVRMACAECGCEFIVGPHEYRLGDTGAEASCPECGSRTGAAVQVSDAAQVWIECREELPPKGEKVLVITQQGAAGIGEYVYTGSNGAVWCKLGKKTYSCIYWTPLPPLPEAAKVDS